MLQPAAADDATGHPLGGSAAEWTLDAPPHALGGVDASAASEAPRSARRERPSFVTRFGLTSGVETSLVAAILDPHAAAAVADFP